MPIESLDKEMLYPILSEVLQIQRLSDDINRPCDRGI